MAINSIILEGQILDQPIARKTAKQASIATFTIQCPRSHSQEPNDCDYFDIELRNNNAILAHSMLKKDQRIRVVGKLRQDRWVDQDNIHYSQVKVVAEHLEYAVHKTSA